MEGGGKQIWRRVLPFCLAVFCGVFAAAGAQAATTTLYPSPYFNTDGTTAVKHIFAPNGEVLATIEGSGASVEASYVHADHLTGSNVVTDNAGNVVEVTDYYPYGSIRLDEKRSSFSEQRKFAGHEYDDSSDLTYMNARYYDGRLGRFISQDPLEIVGFRTTAPEKFETLASNPQYWNTYSYALNNPLAAVDPSGLLTVVVPGTWHNAETWQNEQGFLGRIQSTFGEKPTVLNWSGGDNRWERAAAAGQLFSLVNNHEFKANEKLNIVGHSHGGNIALLASHMLERPIDNLVTFALPVRSDYQAEPGKINNHINVYTNFDAVQVLGGGSYSITGLLGRMFGRTGERVGELLGLGEFGPAGFWVQSARNRDATNQAIGTPWGSHSGLWRRPGVWQKHVQPFVVK